MDLLDVIRRYHYFGMKDVVIEYLSREERGATTEWRGVLSEQSCCHQSDSGQAPPHSDVASQ